MNWNKKTNNLICLDEKYTGFNRSNRNDFDINDINIKNNILNKKYSDYHCLRPMSDNSEINWKIYNLL